MNNMRYNILSIETKKPDWKVAVIQDMTTQEVKERVSINRTDKNGVPFPNFDTLKVNDTVEGNFWASPSGSAALYPPRPQTTANRGLSPNKVGSAAISKAQETKRENIQESQERKDLSIKISSTMRDAVLLATAEYTHNQDRSLDQLVVKWRHWLFLQWDKTDPSSIAPF